MRRFIKIFSVLAFIGFIGVALVAPAAAQPRQMGDDIFTPLFQGYEFMSKGKYDAAQVEFEKVIKADFYNPYANNNMAVLMEKQGKMQDAMTYLTNAEKYADQYLYKVDQVCLIGGLCSAVKPEKTTTPKSTISGVIADNKKKLAAKMGPKPADIPKDVPKMK
ncbi:tetratricopeptide repeat protein [Desulfobacca acetoxidans]|uniref:Uncharacterized protein n=1 Tax=Desulfobacca acetoxidans (strain ATCC 700848 / DSM 11109 / ASRB2) TaxID=880072 RepID=F2NDT9_DESAR|nr:hypothetical protein [Desulfobacca acetoxidans]AEB10436.1 hypothetical protein Desac_2619 [Desulfobacca acetoxidans DSM 11109]HAY20863.1 hypothetical protein [Desulfobacterales bacterium]